VKNFTILVIDDDPVTRRYVSHMLTVANYQVDGASDGNEALTKTRQFNYDLAVVDLVLPGEMNGLDIIKSLKKNAPNMRIVAFSAYSGKNFGTKTMNVGADAYVPKANMGDQLVPTVNRLLGREDDSPERVVKPQSPVVYEHKTFVPDVLKGIPEGAVEEIINLAKRVTMAAGNRIPVNVSKELTIIATGRAKCIYQDTTICQLKEGESIGDEALLLKDNPNENVFLEAEEELEILIIPKENLEHFFAQHDQNLFIIYQTNVILNLSQKLQEAYKSLPVIGQKKPEPVNANGKAQESALSSDIDIIELLNL